MGQFKRHTRPLTSNECPKLSQCYTNETEIECIMYVNMYGKLMLMIRQSRITLLRSVCTGRLPVVLLEPPVLSGVLQRRCLGRFRDLRHFGTYCWLLQGRRSGVQGNCQQIQLETHRGGLGRRDGVPVLVRSEAVE